MAEPILISEPPPRRTPGAPGSRRPRAVPHVHTNARPAAEDAARDAAPPAPPEPQKPPAASRRPLSRRALLTGILLALGLNLAGLLPALRSPRSLDSGDVLLALVTLVSGLVLLVLAETGRRRRSPPRAR